MEKELKVSNIFDGKLENQPVSMARTMHSSDLLPGIVKQRNIFGGYIIFHGNVADRPADGSANIRAYFAEDEDKLYIWNSSSSSWVSVTLS